jgi:hypothetical protein
MCHKKPCNSTWQGRDHSYYLLYLVLMDLVEALFTCLPCFP